MSTECTPLPTNAYFLKIRAALSPPRPYADFQTHHEFGPLYPRNRTFRGLPGGIKSRCPVGKSHRDGGSLADLALDVQLALMEVN